MRDGSLAAERSVAIRTIDEFFPHRAWAWERDAQAGPYSSAPMCIRNARTSDGLILIIADDLTPITKREYLAARRRGVPTYIMIKDGAGQTLDAEQFILREQRRAVTKLFNNTRELRTHIRASLHERLLRVSRESILGSRRLPR